jgi:hypothetical protein
LHSYINASWLCDTYLLLFSSKCKHKTKIKAHRNRYVIFLSGHVEISFPNSTEKHVFKGGKHNIIFADDTADKTESGHISTVLDEDSESLMFPLANGSVPLHRVLYDGVCAEKELRL